MILITGSSGFLGSNLSSHLINRKHDVVGFTIKPTKQLGLRQIRGNITNVKDIPRETSCIVHYAALTNIDYCESNPKECFKTNVLGTQHMLDLARKRDSKFIFASSSQVYGAPKKLPISEDDELHPLSVYAASKAASEIICEAYSKSYGLDVIVVRSFSIFGPKSPSYLVTSKIIKQIIENKKIVIGNVFPRRDFVYVDDLVSAFELLIRKNLKGFSKYNIGSGKSTSIKEICNKLIKISQSKIPIEIDKKLIRKSEIPNLTCNASKIKKLGWHPQITLDKGLSLTFQWFKNQKAHNV